MSMIKSITATLNGVPIDFNDRWSAKINVWYHEAISPCFVRLKNLTKLEIQAAMEGKPYTNEKPLAQPSTNVKRKKIADSGNDFIENEQNTNEKPLAQRLRSRKNQSAHITSNSIDSINNERSAERCSNLAIKNKDYNQSE